MIQDVRLVKIIWIHFLTTQDMMEVLYMVHLTSFTLMTVNLMQIRLLVMEEHYMQRLMMDKSWIQFSAKISQALVVEH